MAGLSGLVYYLRVRPDYPRGEHLKGASLRQDPVLLTNIRLSCKGLQVTNTLAY